MRHIGSCPVCDGGRFDERFAATFQGDWRDAVPYFLTERVKAVHGRVVRCADCGFCFTTPQFTPEDYDRIYAAVHLSRQGEASTPQGSGVRLAELARRVGQHETTGRFLDFGCGRGEFLDAMGAGHDGLGFEVAADIPGGVSRSGRIVTGNILTQGPAAEQAGLTDAGFDFIAAWDVLEHLPEPEAQMRRLGDLLRPDGRLYLTLPDAASAAARLSGGKWNLLLLEHLWYFDPATLARFLTRCGFVVEEISKIGYPVDLETLARRLRQTYGDWVPPLPSFLGRPVISLPIGLMFVRARRA
ncbi:MAG: class I SAM-dependent methyltransferase [Phaeospirillum sp.]|nr:class I SAM-dependent methyltransferase [Phaeospirillum sp.]